MLRFFIDSSALYSLCHSQKGAAYALFEQAQRGKVILVVSEYVFLEVENYLVGSDFEHYLKFRQHEVWEIVETMPDEDDDAIGAVADPNDAPIVSAAKKAKVNALVSFDRKHLHNPAVEAYIHAPVVTAGDALKHLLSVQS